MSRAALFFGDPEVLEPATLRFCLFSRGSSAGAASRCSDDKSVKSVSAERSPVLRPRIPAKRRDKTASIEKRWTEVVTATLASGASAFPQEKRANESSPGRKQVTSSEEDSGLQKCLKIHTPQ